MSSEVQLRMSMQSAQPDIINFCGFCGEFRKIKKAMPCDCHKDICYSCAMMFSLPSLCTGWSLGVSRRFNHLLGRLKADYFNKLGSVYSFTFTVRECPNTPDEWAYLRERFFNKMKNKGMLGCIHVTEWQRRRVPHLHVIAVFKKPIDGYSILNMWCKTANFIGKYSTNLSAGRGAQSFKPVWDLAGIIGYLKSHLIKSAKTVQRADSSIPENWNGHTTQMWGVRGDVQFSESLVLGMLFTNYYFNGRRWLSRLALAEHRARWLSEWDDLSESARIRNPRFREWVKALKRRRTYLQQEIKRLPYYDSDGNQLIKPSVNTRRHMSAARSICVDVSVSTRQRFTNWVINPIASCGLSGGFSAIDKKALFLST